MAVSSVSEEGLDHSLTRIRDFFFCGLVAQLFRTCFFDSLDSEVPTAELGRRCGFDQGVLEGAVRFLCDEGVLCRRGDRVVLTACGQELRAHEGWYRLLVGGYLPTLNSLQDVLVQGKTAGIRNELEVAVGSGLVDYHDVIPAVDSAISEFGIDPSRVLDLGCGIATCLIALCQRHRCATGTGVAFDSDVSALARERVASAGLSQRIRIETHDAATFEGTDYTLLLSAFVFQEIAFQRGVPGLIEAIRGLRTAHPHAHLLVVEVPRPTSAADLTSGIAQYYHSYLLVHELTRQELLSAGDWCAVFHSAGYEVLGQRPLVQGLDTSGMETCFVLRPSGLQEVVEES